MLLQSKKLVRPAASRARITGSGFIRGFGMGTGVSGKGEIRVVGSCCGRELKYEVIFLRFGVFLARGLQFCLAFWIRSSRMAFQLS